MPDVILLDWNMPVMNGLEFLVSLRALAADQPIVVFCTTENNMDHVRKAIEAGANEYIMKPFDSYILQSKFAQVGLV
jgi:two-component system chemotaxis response regulator CheY